MLAEFISQEFKDGHLLQDGILPTMGSENTRQRGPTQHVFYNERPKNEYLTATGFCFFQCRLSNERGSGRGPGHHKDVFSEKTKGGGKLRGGETYHKTPHLGKNYEIPLPGPTPENWERLQQKMYFRDIFPFFCGNFCQIVPPTTYYNNNNNNW